MISDELTREDRISNEIKRLKTLLKNIHKDKLKAAEGLIQRISFMQVTLEDLESDINLNGAIEPFSQTENIVYDRERPATRIYNTTIKNYTTACKQLFDLLPDANDKSAAASEEEKKFLDFIKGGRR